MSIIALLFLVVFAASVYGLRTAGGEPRWPFAGASMLSGGAILVAVLATVISSISGRDTWNNWVSGSPSSETVTLWMVFIVAPLVLAASLALLVIGTVVRIRSRRFG
jgi:hypothetical protein